MSIERKGRLRRALIVLLLAASIGAAKGVLVAWPRLRVWNLARLAKALDRRPLRGRLTGFPWIENGPMRGSSSSAGLYAFRAAAAELAIDFDDSTEIDRLHAHAVGLLAAGQVRRAIAELTKAAQAAPDRGDFWNDLAVAQLAAFDAENDASQLVEALGSLDHALRIDCAMLEALLNRAEILEAMGLDSAAAKAWARYIEVDADSSASQEARARRKPLLASTRAEEWSHNIDSLRAAAASRDRETVSRIVAAFPQDARAYSETLFLLDWSHAVKKGDGTAAAVALRLVAAIGNALVAANGDTFVRDMAAAIEVTDDRAAVATAHELYVEARRLYRDTERRVSAALPLFEAAARAFRVNENPLANVAEFYVASCLYDLNHTDEALESLAHLKPKVPDSHVALHAFIQWETGAVYLRKGMLNEARDAQARSTALFTQLGEDANANVIGAMTAATDAVLGRRVQAWRTQREIFSRISRSGAVGDLQRTLDQAARIEALSGEWENAFSLMTLATDPELNRNPRVYVSSVIWHALAAHRLGIESAVSKDVALARVATAGIKDAVMRNRARNDILFCEAVALRTSSPRRATELFDTYIERARIGGEIFLLSEALLERGRAHRAVGNEVAAIHDLRDSLALTRNTSRSMDAAVLRDAYFRTADAAARELVDELVGRGRHEEALAILDSERARPYGIAVSAALPRLPPNTTLVEYVVLPGHLLILVANEHGVRAERVDVSEEQLDTIVAALLRDVDDASNAKQLGRFLLQPVAQDVLSSDRIVFVADRSIARVPFALLPLGDGKQLVELTDFVIAPAAAVAVLRPESSRRAPQSLLAVGNPSFDLELFPDLAPLPGAEREVRRIASSYKNAVTLTGAAATRAAVNRALPVSDVVHIGAHAILLSSDPARSHLLLAPSGADSGVLYLSDIERSVLHATRLVVLAGCDTATPPDVRRNVDTLALAFIAAGATNVVGTLWRVEDGAAEQLAALLHAELQRGSSAATSLRRAQLAMRNSGHGSQRRAGAWAGFQVYGSGE